MIDPAPAVSTEPAKPVDPVKPVEPAQPAAPTAEQVKAELLAAETAAFERAKPVFDKYCANCHSKAGRKQSAAKREHFDMTTYPFDGHHAMDVHNEIRVVLGLTGLKPTMPADKKGAVKGAELDLIKAWADAFDASHKGGAHEGQDEPGGGHKH
jgi:mono/diheme cytochrome c family protein